MAEPERRYEQIPGISALLSPVRSELWWEDDHLLLVRRGSFSESYRRLYLADIQALAIRKTATGRVMNAVCGALAAACAAYGGWVALRGGGAIPMAIMAGVLFLPLLICLAVNTALGPTCECHARTAVQAVRLPSLSRLRAARRALATLRPLIEGAQGGAVPESGTAEKALGVLAADAKSVTHASGRFHWILCYVLLLDVVLCGAHLAGIELDSSISLIWNLAGFAFAIGALVVQRNSDLGRGLRLIPGLALLYIGTFFAVSLGYGIMMVMADPDMVDPSAISQDPVFVAMNLLSMAIDLALGLAGLLLLRAHRRHRLGSAGSVADSMQTQAAAEPEPAPEREGREE